MYCRTNQRRGGVEYTLSRACGVVSFLFLERLLVDLAASFPFPFAFPTRCFIYPSVALHFSFYLSAGSKSRSLELSRYPLVALDFLLRLL